MYQYEKYMFANQKQHPLKYVWHDNFDNCINIKPISVNTCWQGRRFKTKAYKAYEQELLYILPKITLPKDKLEISIEVGLSSLLADLDNIAKPFLDILQKKYLFNDNKIYRLIMHKVKVKKKNEYIAFNIKQYET